MKTLTLLLPFFIFSFSTPTKKIPTVDVKDLQNRTISTSTFNNEGKPMVINFWATWCSPCRKELNNISEVYEDWQEETGVKIIAISIDDTRFLPKVKPCVESNGWEYEIYTDANQDFKRAMNVNNVPHTFLLDGKGNIVYEHNNYAPGDEDVLYEEILKLTTK